MHRLVSACCLVDLKELKRRPWYTHASQFTPPRLAACPTPAIFTFTSICQLESSAGFFELPVLPHCFSLDLDCYQLGPKSSDVFRVQTSGTPGFTHQGQSDAGI